MDNEYASVSTDLLNSLVKIAKGLNINWRYKSSVDFPGAIEIIDEYNRTVALIYTERRPLPTIGAFSSTGLYYTALYEFCTDQGGRDQPPEYEFIEVCDTTQSFCLIAEALLCKEVSVRVVEHFDIY